MPKLYCSVFTNGLGHVATRFAASVVLATLLVVSGPVQAAERVALIVGVSEYSSIPPLKNTVNDAQGIADTLESIGFEVELLLDPGGQELRTALEAFSFESETADLAMIYFAGHGVEVAGENWLIPADAQIANNRDIQQQSVSLKDMLESVDRARKLRIVILDSCRDNPFADVTEVAALSSTGTAGVVTVDSETRSIGAGLASPTPDRGTLVAFAARDGNVAMDGGGDNSPFALALMDKLGTQGLEISLMFRQVRDDVLRRTNNLQEPHTYGSLSGIPFYLAGGNAPAAQDQFSWTSLRPDDEAQFEVLAQEGDTRSLLGLAYMRLDPNDERFNPLEAAELLQRAADAGSPEAQYELALLYEKGRGLPQDLDRALALYRLAADQDFADALNDMGFFHYQGMMGLPQNQAEALRYFERAADQRHPQAMYNFAALIDDGLIPGKGPEAAAAYLYDSLRIGNAEVLKVLIEHPASLKAETRRALQRKLQEHAFYEGTIDGDFGPGTQRGLRQAYGLPG